MGRELKRVSLDFDWPIGERWKGYVNPHYEKCPHCERGYTQAREFFECMVRLILLGGENAASGKVHPYLQNIMSYDGRLPSVDMVELTAGLAEREIGLIGYDSGAAWKATKNIIKTAGLDPDRWGICPTCGGDAINPAKREAYEAWKNYDPPKGDGFQLWETTSEGSPVSPVFATLDELCEWAAENATTFARYKATKEEWKKMLDDDFVCHKSGNMVFI